jgi:hypothetical protein
MSLYLPIIMLSRVASNQQRESARDWKNGVVGNLPCLNRSHRGELTENPTSQALKKSHPLGSMMSTNKL